MQVNLSSWQTEVWEDKHRFKVVCAGRRSGKSTLAILQIIAWANEEKGLYWIVSPTYKQTKQVFWKELQHYVPQKLITKKNEVDLSVTLVNGSTIELKGAENPDSLRGVKLRALIVDEIASIRNWDWLWQEVLRATLTDYQAPVLFISTPKGYNHFKELFEAGQHENSSYKSWRFTSYENPYIAKEEIDEAKKELTEDTFAQEYLADFRKFVGLVYKGFQREVHVIEPFDLPANYQLYRGLDFGSTNPTVCLWVAVDSDENIYIADEHYETGQTIDYHAGVISSHSLSSRVSKTWGDPSGAQWIKEFQQRGVYITPAVKEASQNFNSWVRFGIEKVAEKLKLLPKNVARDGSFRNGLNPSLFVFNTCVNTIREFETYRWREKSVTQAQDLNEPDVPEKANDHAMDALRYIVVSKNKFQAINFEDLPKYKPVDDVIGI